MATTTIDRAIRTNRGQDVKDHEKGHATFFERVKDWAETYAAYKIEKENWQRFT